MASYYKPKGAVKKYKPYESRVDVRRSGTKAHEFLLSNEGSIYLIIGVIFSILVLYSIPFSGPILLLVTYILYLIYMRPDRRIANFPWRVPSHAKLFDGSKNKDVLDKLYKGNVIKYNPEKFYGEGITYYGIDRETGLQVYSDNSDDRTHLVILGTTGSGKTELILALVFNQLVQDSGFILLDAKGDPTLQKDIARLTARFMRDDDRLTINFITSGRNLAKAQKDKVTNTFNLMSNTSDQMLIELLNNLLDGSSGGDDFWKGRAMTFIASITVVLVYLRDNGFIQLSPSAYIRYLELSALEELVFEHDNKYGEEFNMVTESLKNYITTLPAYKNLPRFRKRQDADTLKQHGFIVMQLTRCFNELTYNYKYIFGVPQGDIDIFDCVLNRRILTIPLPALERTQDSLKLLGKLCIGSIKQMMASSLGNRIEGLVREILDSRATNAINTFRCIMDEVGYVMVKGISVMPAQARSLNFAICFAAQDFSDIRRGDEHEAEAIWSNAGAKFVGRIVIGDGGETMGKINGLVEENYQARYNSTKMQETATGFKPITSQDISFQREKDLIFGDLAGQAQGEFTLFVGLKEDGGVVSGLKVVRIQAFYAAGETLKYLRMNDLCPNLSIPVDRIENPNIRIENVTKILSNPSIANNIGVNRHISSTRFFINYDHVASGDDFKLDKIRAIKAFLNSDMGSSIVDSYDIPVRPSLISAKQSTSIHDIEINADQAHSDIADDVNISKSVSQEIIFQTDEEKAITKSSVRIVNEIEVEIKDSLSSKVVSIFDFMNYADESYQRLKAFNIQCDLVKKDYQLLSFMPSNLDGLDAEKNAELRDAFNKISEKIKVNISDQTASTANELHKLVTFNISGITNTTIQPPIESTDTKPDSRNVALELIEIIEAAKKGVGFK